MKSRAVVSSAAALFLMSLTLSTAPSFEPITAEEAIRHLRGEGALESERETATLLVTAAREQLELETHRAYMKQTWTLKLHRWWGSRALEIPRPPLLSVDSITYIDSDGNSQTLSTSVYTVVTRHFESPFGSVFLARDQEWPDLRGDDNAHEITITFTAGYSSSAVEATQRAAVPKRARLALRQLVAHWFDTARAVGHAGPFTTFPHGYERVARGLWVPSLDYELEAA